MSTRLSHVSMAFILRHWSYFLAFGFGSGLSPYAPGTVGSIVAVPLFWLGLVCGLTPLWILIACVPAFFVGIWACNQTTHALQVHDYSGIVWDEIVAMWVVLACVPATWTAWLCATILFRLFDILKPWPIRWFDRHVEGGLGIMLDDVLAAMFALAVFYGLMWTPFAHWLSHV